MKRIDPLSYSDYVPFSEQHRRLNDGSDQGVKQTPFDHPENVRIQDIDNIVPTALYILKNTSPFENTSELREKVLNASHIWWRKASEIPSLPRKFIQDTCIQLIMRAQLLGTNFRGPLTCNFSDGSHVQIMPANFDVLCMASPVIRRMFSNAMKESLSNQFYLDISPKVFSEIVIKLLNSQHFYSEEINKLELLAAVHYLEIGPLKREILDFLDDNIKEAKPEMLEEMITLYKTFVDESYTDDRKKKLCLAALMKIVLNDTAINRVESKLDFTALNALIPGLTFSKPGVCDGADGSKVVKKLVIVDTSIQDNYKELRCLLAAAECIKSKKYSEAAAHLETIANTLPAQYLFAYSYYRQNQYALAQDVLKRLQTEINDLWWFRALQGLCALKLGMFVLAEIHLTSLGYMQPKMEMLVELAQVYMIQGKWKEASYTITQALQIDPENEEALLEQARYGILFRFKSQFPLDPMFIISMVLKNNPSSAKALFLQGLYYLEFFYPSEYQAACNSFDQCLEVDNEFCDAYRGRGVVKLKLDRLEEALNDLKKAVDLQVGDLVAWTNLAKCLRLLNKLTEAQISITTAMIINNSDVNVVLEKGIIEVELGNYDSSINYLNSLVHPCNQAKMFLAKAYRLKGDLPKALSAIMRCDFRDDIASERLYCIEKGKIHLAQNDLLKAIISFNCALKIKEDPEILCLRGQIYLNRKTKKKAALEDFQRALELQPGYPLALEGIELAKNTTS